MTERPNVENTLARLKDFQRTSVDYVYRRLYTDNDQVDRFLLADEVGLGKTLVARGVIARAVEYLWDHTDRISVVYICANSDIARQNISRLRLEGQDDFGFASRLTLLPLHMADLASRKLNFVSFTPGTSFELGRRSGIMEERALLYYLLEDIWNLKGMAPKNILQGGAGTDGWRIYLDSFANEKKPMIDSNLSAAFAAELKVMPELRNKFVELCTRFRRDRKRIPWEDRELRNGVIGELRRILATCCVKELKPDLVILDEFQRFRYILQGDDEVARLARELLQYQGSHDHRVRVLLLSATPYKMYTLAQEVEGDDHYRDFLKTTSFLLSSEAETSEFERELREYRTALCLGGEDGAQRLDKARTAIESRLRKVMCRTERLAASTDRNGMLKEVPSVVVPEPRDTQAFVWIDKVASVLETGDYMELWKSGAYLLNFMDDYELKRKARQAAARNDSGLRKVLRQTGSSLFQSNAVQRYEEIDSGNARLRLLLNESVNHGYWKLLWMPPSLPYYSPEGIYADANLAGFTKSLIFSSWRLVPKIIAALASYEAERQMVRLGNLTVGYSELHDRQSPLLRFAQDEGRLTGMPLLSLLYPCRTLADTIDPLELGRQLSHSTLASVGEIIAAAAKIVDELLHPFLSKVRHDGPPDDRWYWAALLMLDRDRWPGMGHWLRADDYWAWRRMAGDDETLFLQHVNQAQRFFELPDALGSPPANLVEVLAKVAVASPAVVALRTLARHWPLQSKGQAITVQSDSEFSSLPTAAAWIAMGFRALFNRPEVILLLRGLNGTEPYWERILDYAVGGNLQAVMDEYVHVLVDSLGGAYSSSALKVSEQVHDAIALRTTTLSHDEFTLVRGKISVRQHRMRCNYALYFGEGENEEGGDVTRQDEVRMAFNSPFRPFILASTSIGQEGLDFHLYCRAIYHWNLPANPVDLEQREGRVHRYKGHVIRNNLAAKYGIQATNALADPWEALFVCAASDRPCKSSDLIPYWILDGPWKIERRVPMFPLSREIDHLEDLKKTLALYRLVFGQPRQEELLKFLCKQTDDPSSARDLLRYQVDLTPKPRA